MKKKLLFIIQITLLGIWTTNAFSQGADYTWWNTMHHWDGKSPWDIYLIMSTGYLGPNGLPVPPVRRGCLDTMATLEAGWAEHYSVHDNTNNMVSDLFVPVDGKVAIELYLVPVEYYKMDTFIRDQRVSRDYNSAGSVGGDFYVTGYYQLIKNHPTLPDVLLSFTIKTASGKALEAARYTDAPGYYFDLSFGKTYHLNDNFTGIRPYLTLGFYAWQTYQEQSRQDDAAWYGAGLQLIHKRFLLDYSIGGLYGWVNDGDRPLVTRLCIRGNNNHLLNYKVMLEAGLNDYAYKSIIVSGLLNLEPLRRKIRAVLHQ